MSGNGSYILYQIDLPNDAESLELLTTVLTTLPAKFNTAQAHVDTTVSNAARQVIAQEGLVTTTNTTGAVHVHPLFKVERKALAVFTRCWREMRLSWPIEQTTGRTRH